VKFSYVYAAMIGRIRVYGVDRKLDVVSPTQQTLSILDLWWTKWHWNWSDYFFSSSQYHSTNVPHSYIRLSATDAVWA